MNIMAIFSTYIRNIAIFLIFMAFVGIVIPNSKYKEYINLTLGFILVFLVVSPLQPLLAGSDNSIEQIIYDLTNEIQSQSLSQSSSYFTQAQNEQILDAYKSDISAQIENIVNTHGVFLFYNCSVTVDNSEDRYGQIDYISVTITEKEESSQELASKPFIRIEPVQLDNNSIFVLRQYDQELSAMQEASESEDIRNLKKVFSDFYNLSYDNIYITVQKKSKE